MFNMYLSYYVSYTCVNTFIFLTGKNLLGLLKTLVPPCLNKTVTLLLTEPYNNFIINTYNLYMKE